MTLQEMIYRSILQAGLNTPDGENYLMQQQIETEVAAARALRTLASDVSKDPERKHLLMKTTSVPLTNGVGTLDASLLTDSIDTGSVRDADASANNGYGNVLVRVHNYNDFLRELSPFFGYFALHNNQIHTRAISSGSFTDTLSPLTVDCSYVPTAAEVPAEIEYDAVSLLVEYLLKQRI